MVLRIIILIISFLIVSSYTVRIPRAEAQSSEIVRNCTPHSISDTSASIQVYSENGLEGLLNACPGQVITIPKNALAGTNQLIVKDAKQYVSEPKLLYGMGAFYNTIRRLEINPDGSLNQLEPEAPAIAFGEGRWVGLAGRFKVLIINAPGGEVSFENEALILSWPPGKQEDVRIILGTSRDVVREMPELDVIRYSNIWNWLGALARAAEWTLSFVQQNIVSSWGWAIIVFGILIKLLLLPVTFMTMRFQRTVSQYQAILEPKLAEIAAKYDGEEAYSKTMAQYKELGITPFYALKPLIGSFIQVPILIAIFNALGEMPQFGGESFLWIKDLAYPDSVMNLPFVVPTFGSTINLLPFLMTAFSLVATVLHQNRHSTPKERRREKRNLYLMAVVFFVLFYPFPASMVLYWTVSNVLFLLQQQLLKT
jgi:YidC/Oxa1 family membrane protein insertase